MTATTMQHRIATIIDDMFLDGPDAAARAILAALPGMIPDLVWEGDHDASGKYSVDGDPGNYEYLHFDHPYWDYSGREDGIWFPTKEAAKAAANAHNRAAIAKAAGWTND
jgi:hypothetical protein